MGQKKKLLIFADDSSSMAAYGRMESLKKTAIHVAAIATALKESSQHIGGLSIRFINYGGDGNKIGRASCRERVCR